MRILRIFDDQQTPPRIDWRLVAVFVIVNGLVLYNAIMHDPTIQYDSGGHLAYVQAIAELHLPSAKESSEFFSAPLPYLIPAIARAAGLSIWWAAKVGQLINVLLSLGLTGMLITLCRAIRPGDRDMPLIALMGLGILPVYYKTMAYVRGEPYVAFLTVAGMAVTAKAVTAERRSWADIIVLGVCWGLLALARQWGVLAVIGMLLVVALIALPSRERDKWLIGLAAPLIALAVGGWFYGWLLVAHGSAIAFNRDAADQWALDNQPADFYTGTGNGKLFSDPVRPSMPNQVGPIFYAETWGDYWGFFSISGKDVRSGAYVTGPEFQDRVANAPETLDTNRFTLNGTLGRIELIGLLPTALALIGLGWAVTRLAGIIWRGAPLTPAEVIPATAVLVIVVSVIGYLWFLIRFPNLGKGDTIKATYMLHIFAPMALLAADFLRRVRIPAVAWLIGWGLLLIHNLPAMTTHFFNMPQ